MCVSACAQARCWCIKPQDHITQPKLLTMDILVLATMKNAAKCDTQCELQNSVNHQNFERILRSEVFLRACLSQWHLPLSPCGLSSPRGSSSVGRQDCEPSEVSSSDEVDLCRSKSRVGPLGDTFQTVCAQRSVVVGCLAHPFRSLSLCAL